MCGESSLFQSCGSCNCCIDLISLHFGGHSGMRSEKGTIRPYGVTVLPTAGSFRYKLISVSDGDKTGRQAGRQLGSKNLTIPGRAGNRQGYYELIISNASPNQSSITTWTQACMHAHTPWENTCRSPVYFYIAASHPYCTSYFPPPTPPPRYPTIHTPAQPACRPHPLRLHRPGPWESHNQCSYLPLSPARHVVLTCPVLYPNTTSPHALSCHHQSGVSFHQQDGHLPSTECSLPIPKTPFLNPF